MIFLILTDISCVSIFGGEPPVLMAQMAKPDLCVTPYD